MRSILRWLLSDPTSTAAANAATMRALRDALVTLEARVTTLENEDAEREARHADAMQKLARIHKRMAQRFANETQDAAEPRESPFDLRRRLGK